MSFDFPSDLIEASLTCKKLREELEALPVDDGLTLKDETPLVRARAEGRRATKVYTEDDRAHEARLRADLQKAAELVVTHPFWESLPAEDRMKARAALKHHGESG
ncbi:hypothetical protein ABZ383_34575 [Streptomyces sp. NPDC005900]|uniref:hypothetical protein n=1 Tax=Streptomyces sp. NPDC005900 TaxID=3154569 RepID=UPI0034103923